MNEQKAGSPSIRPAFQQRVIEEHEQLAAKVNKLQTFVHTEGTSFNDLPQEEQISLMIQLDIMWAYLHVLQSRINRF